MKLTRMNEEIYCQSVLVAIFRVKNLDILVYSPLVLRRLAEVLGLPLPELWCHLLLRLLPSHLPYRHDHHRPHFRHQQIFKNELFKTIEYIWERDKEGDNEEHLEWGRALCLQVCSNPLHRSERERERERDWERGRETEKEGEREGEYIFFKGMMGALAPFIYLVT